VAKRVVGDSKLRSLAFMETGGRGNRGCVHIEARESATYFEGVRARKLPRSVDSAGRAADISQNGLKWFSGEAEKAGLKYKGNGPSLYLKTQT